ncbi:molecular chaperone GroEL [Massilia sp. CCM 8695]|uniref:Molecular chaperone GroEL n=1 Tax=Massilia frigida TaxID=2609281 RepID=A0ABX0NDS0_9BURK|nr:MULTISPECIES: DUF6463 family protein [Massilia]MDM5179534.1 DUF6463 family protein [Massilia sp. DJPM01]NHZ79850.1 molecular chaperone GroEL [Massilia frigida]
MKHWISRWLVGVAFLHTVFAFVVMGPVMLTMLRNGLFDTAKSMTEGATTWFFLFGLLLALFAVPVHALEKAGVALPKAIGWGLLGMAALGVVLMPDSGFWLVFPPALAILLRKAGARVDAGSVRGVGAA